jgi:outer membrane protein
LRKNIEQAYTDQAAAHKNFVATTEQLASETRAYTDMEKKFNVGLASATDFLIEKNNYYKAVFANLQSKYEYIFKTRVVDFYTGTPLTQQ